MPNINAFEAVVHEKILKDFPPFGPLNDSLRGQPLDFNKSKFLFPRDVSFQIWLKSSD